MKCRRCNEVDVPSYRVSNMRLTIEDMDSLGYCGICWNIMKFEKAKFVKRPYKIPVDRRGV